MNARNLNYIRPNNKRAAKKMADDKLLSKRKLKKAGLPVPKLIGAVRTHEELADFDFSKLPNSFVLKPNFGFGGEGILVVYGRRKGEEPVWVKADGSRVTVDDLKNQIRNILDGSYSRTGISDEAFFEERIKLSKVFKPYSYKGMPDVRVIVYNNVPVMAMLRLATKESDGKANLQLGGIGCGVDMATGVVTTSIQGKSRLIENIPGTPLVLRGLKIPFWDQILEMAVKAQRASNLGFLGADIAIDRDLGPVFLELNARPGLSIQIANQDGLLARLQRVEGLKIMTVKRGVALAKNLFGGEIEEEIEEMSGKRVIGSIEKVKLIGKNGKEIEVEAKIDTGADSTSIDLELARQLGFSETITSFNKVDVSGYDLVPGNEKKIKSDFMEKFGKKISDLHNVAVVFSSSGKSMRPVVKCHFVMDNERVLSRINIVDRSKLKYSMIVGRKDLRKFLVEV